MSDERSIPVKIADEVLRGAYANQMVVRHTREEFVLDFLGVFPPEAVVNFARGTSEDPASPHFDDRDPAWTAIEYEPLLFRQADVEAKVTERQTLEAKK